MNIALFAYSRQGCVTARRVLTCFPEDTVHPYTMERFAEPGFGSIQRPARDFYGPLFQANQALIFISSVGLAVREIAPHLRNKATDPAVIVLDELGQFVIPVLSGHIGGANDMAKKIAENLGSTPVITTATDINGRFSVDAWATKQGCAISSLSAAKAVSAAVLEGDVPLCTPFPIVTALPKGLCLGDSGKTGILLDWKKATPFDTTLRLTPKILHLGIGCRKGTSKEAISEAVGAVLSENQIDRKAVKCCASIDLKAQETGLLDFCREAGLPVKFYSAEQLNAVPGDFTPSAFVRSVTGVDNVCERAALLGAETLIIKKTARDGVTVALAAEHWEVSF